MRFKTCSYKSINILEKYSFVPISFCKPFIRKGRGVTLPELAPLPFLIKGLQNGTISKNLFRMLYIKQLDRCNDMSNLILKLLSYGGKICLVSSGGYNELNHRVILAKKERMQLQRIWCQQKKDAMRKWAVIPTTKHQYIFFRIGIFSSRSKRNLFPLG